MGIYKYITDFDRENLRKVKDQDLNEIFRDALEVDPTLMISETTSVKLWWSKTVVKYSIYHEIFIDGETAHEARLQISASGSKQLVTAYLFGIINSKHKPFINLTEKWLIDFGFERNENSNKQPNWIWCKKGEIWLYQDWKTKSFVFNSHLKSNSTIKYVHQLQDLYFSLTGEDLTKTTSS